MATRRSQPYRKGSLLRNPSPQLAAMKRGRTLYGRNPQDIKRLAVKRASRRKRRRYK